MAMTQKRGRWGKVDAFAGYLRECDEVKLLTADEEKDLARRLKAGDAAAGERLARANLRLVVSIARQFRGRGVDLEDLVCEGNLGLLRAVGDFDPDYDVKFSTYASYWIKQKVRMAIRDQGGRVRIPSYLHDLMGKWNDAAARLADESGETPTEDEVASELGLTSKPKVVRCVKAAMAMRNVESLDEIRDRKGWSDSREFMEPEGHFARPGSEIEREEESAAEAARLESALDALDARERGVVRGRFGLGGSRRRTLKEAGEAYGVTKERARQIEQDGLVHLREILDGRMARGA